MKHSIFIFLPATDLFGAPKFGIDLANQLASSRDDADIFLVFPSDQGIIPTKIFEKIEDGVKILDSEMPILRRYKIRRNVIKQIWYILRQGNQFRKFAKKLPPNSKLHFVSITNISAMFLPLSRRDLVISWSVHEYMTKLERITLGNLLSRAKYVTACSNYIKNTLPRVIQKRAHVIYSGVNIKSFSTFKKLEPVDHINILCVGRLNNWKGQDILLYAFAEAQNSLKFPAKLTIIGSPVKGENLYIENLNSIVKKRNLYGLVEFVSENFEIGDFFNQSDILVVPSKKPEPFGRTTVEGLYWECAVIATKPGGSEEILGEEEFGINVACNDVLEMKDALVLLINNREIRERFQHIGRERALQFDISKTYKPLVEFLLI